MTNVVIDRDFARVIGVFLAEKAEHDEHAGALLLDLNAIQSLHTDRLALSGFFVECLEKYLTSKASTDGFAADLLLDLQDAQTEFVRRVDPKDKTILEVISFALKWRRLSKQLTAERPRTFITNRAYADAHEELCRAIDTLEKHND